MKFEIREITQDEANAIIEKREPLGLFYFVDGNVYVGIENKTWDAWTEEFASLEDCLNWLNEDVIALSTFPDCDEHYCKVFVVPKDWLLDILERLDEMNERKGVDLENFLENYVWDETWFIYEQAKAFGEILREEEQK